MEEIRPDEIINPSTINKRIKQIYKELEEIEKRIDNWVPDDLTEFSIGNLIFRKGKIIGDLNIIDDFLVDNQEVFTEEEEPLNIDVKTIGGKNEDEYTKEKTLKTHIEQGNPHTNFSDNNYIVEKNEYYFTIINKEIHRQADDVPMSGKTNLLDFTYEGYIEFVDFDYGDIYILDDFLYYGNSHFRAPLTFKGSHVYLGEGNYLFIEDDNKVANLFGDHMYIDDENFLQGGKYQGRFMFEGEINSMDFNLDETEIKIDDETLYFKDAPLMLDGLKVKVKNDTLYYDDDFNSASKDDLDELKDMLENHLSKENPHNWDDDYLTGLDFALEGHGHDPEEIEYKIDIVGEADEIISLDFHKDHELRTNENTLEAPVGSIIWFTRGIIPPGFEICDGSKISENNLSEKIKDLLPKVDGDYLKPDLIGRYIRGHDGHDEEGPANRDPDGNREIGSYQSDDFKSHDHRVTESTGESRSKSGTTKRGWRKKSEWENSKWEYTRWQEDLDTFTEPFNMSLVPLIKVR